MSTNQTTNYGLHQWEAEDTFSREEINENFATLDTAVFAASMVTGTYEGQVAVSYETKIQTIELGFRPKAVLVLAMNRRWENEHPLGMVVEGSTDDNMELTDTGFQVRGRLNYRDSPTNNVYCNPYRYIAWR